MLGMYLAQLTALLAQMEGALGVPIPGVTAAREALERAKQSPDPIELEQRLAEATLAIREIAAGQQPAPNSLLAALLGALEQHRQMREHVAAGRQVAWAQEQIAINGELHTVLTGAWTLQREDPAEASNWPSEPQKPAVRARRKR